MKNKMKTVKLILIFALLASSLACGSQSKSGENTANLNAVNVNSNANTTAANNAPAATNNKRDPKMVCAYLPEFPVGEYKALSDKFFQCKSNKTETLSPGKHSLFEYSALGEKADDVKYVQLSTTCNAKADVCLKAEDKLIETAERLFQKVFDAPLPADIKAEMEKSKGKMIDSVKDFKAPTRVEVRRSNPGQGIYALNFQIYLPE